MLKLPHHLSFEHARAGTSTMTRDIASFPQENVQACALQRGHTDVHNEQMAQLTN
jgi:hypothetical protein